MNGLFHKQERSRKIRELSNLLNSSQHVLDAISSKLIRKQSRKWQINDIKCRCKRRSFHIFSVFACSIVYTCVCVLRWFVWFLLRLTVAFCLSMSLPLIVPMQIEKFTVSFMHSVVCIDRKYFLDLVNNGNSICIDCYCVRHKSGNTESRGKKIVKSNKSSSEQSNTKSPNNEII